MHASPPPEESYESRERFLHFTTNSGPEGNVNLLCFGNHIPLSLASRTVCLQWTCDKPATRYSLFCKHLTTTTQ